MPIVHTDLTMICDYCLMEGKLNVGQDQRLGTRWWVLCRAENAADRLSDPLDGERLVFCQQCMSTIDEICRKHRREESNIPNPTDPEPEVPEPLLPEEDLPETSFVGDYANPEIACIGTPVLNSLPDAMDFTDPLWTKRP